MTPSIDYHATPASYESRLCRRKRNGRLLEIQSERRPGKCVGQPFQAARKKDGLSARRMLDIHWESAKRMR
jgi:hypothetical protein